MTRKFLKQLVLKSYQDNKLQSENVLMISETLDRKALKEYLAALKQTEKLRTVYVDVPFDGDDEQIKEVKSLFPGKNIVVRKDPSLLVGMRIANNDDVFEMNLRHHLDAIMSHVENDYDK